VRRLQGDAGNAPYGAVNVSDKLTVVQQIAVPVTAANFRRDVDASGAINVADKLQVVSNIPHSVGACP
jgi:hypothetical protein